MDRVTGLGAWEGSSNMALKIIGNPQRLIGLLVNTIIFPGLPWFTMVYHHIPYYFMASLWVSPFPQPHVPAIPAPVTFVRAQQAVQSAAYSYEDVHSLDYSIWRYIVYINTIIWYYMILYDII